MSHLTYSTQGYYECVAKIKMLVLLASNIYHSMRKNTVKTSKYNIKSCMSALNSLSFGIVGFWVNDTNYSLDTCKFLKKLEYKPFAIFCIIWDNCLRTSLTNNIPRTFNESMHSHQEMTEFFVNDTSDLFIKDTTIC